MKTTEIHPKILKELFSKPTKDEITDGKAIFLNPTDISEIILKEFQEEISPTKVGKYLEGLG